MTYNLSSVQLENIESSEKNFYSLEGTAELAENIRTIGLLHPIRVVNLPSGKCRCIDGHRRLAAYRLLAEEDEGFGSIPAYVVPMMDDLDEQAVLLMANANNRRMTVADLHRQEQELRAVLEARKAAGKPVPRNLQQYMAGVLGVSRNEVSRMHTTNTNLIPEGKELMEAGKLTASAAYDLARKPEAEQREALKAQVKPESPYQRDLDAAEQKAAERVKTLARLAGKYTARYMSDALMVRLQKCLCRNDVLTAVKETECKRYGNIYCQDFRYGFTPKSVSIGDDNGKADCSISEFVDAMMVATLRAFAANKSRAEAAPKKSKVDTSWRTGHPEEPCWCVCRIYGDGMRNPTYMRIWWGGKKWSCDNGTEDLITHWVPEPED